MNRERLPQACFSVLVATWIVGIVFNTVEERGVWDTVGDVNLALFIASAAGLLVLLAIRWTGRRRAARH